MQAKPLVKITHAFLWFPVHVLRFPVRVTKNWLLNVKRMHLRSAIIMRTPGRCVELHMALLWLPAAKLRSSQSVRVYFPKQRQEMLDLLKTREPSLLTFVKQDISCSHHLTVFPLRQRFWEQCMLSTRQLENFLLALFAKYQSLLQESHKGREKYARLQLQWMDCVRIDPYSLCDPAVRWRELSATIEEIPSSNTSSAILSCIAQSVFTFCQQIILAIKEDEHNTVKQMEQLQEAGLSADEAALYRLRGFALFASLKASERLKPDVAVVLKGIRMAAYDKNNLPTKH